MQIQGRLTRRVAQLTLPQIAWLDGQAASLGISWAEFLRRLIDSARFAPAPTSLPQTTPDLDPNIIKALAPETGRVAEAWQSVCQIGRARMNLDTDGCAALLCMVTGRQRGDAINMADCVTTYLRIVGAA